MKGLEYKNFDLVAQQAEVDEHHRLRALHVQVRGTPEDDADMEGQRITVPDGLGLRDGLRELATRRMAGEAKIIAFGKVLAELLFPDGGKARTLFVRSYENLQAGEGLRLRLSLDPKLADYPWEYMYLPFGPGEKSQWFLALNQRLSIVRKEGRSRRRESASANPARIRRLLALLAAPTAHQEYGHLDLEKEKGHLESALANAHGVMADPMVNPTLKEFRSTMLDEALIFHFAGHGADASSSGEDAGIILSDEEGNADRLPASELANRLDSAGVQLAFLGACETGSRAGRNRWNGVAASLMAKGIPAAIAMQFTIRNDCAVEFSEAFYRALAAGAALDYAVSSARIATHTFLTKLPESEREAAWRDWGVPVLYCRASDTFYLPRPRDPALEALGDLLLDTSRKISNVAETKQLHDDLHSLHLAVHVVSAFTPMIPKDGDDASDPDDVWKAIKTSLLDTEHYVDSIAALSKDSETIRSYRVDWIEKLSCDRTELLNEATPGHRAVFRQMLRRFAHTLTLRLSEVNKELTLLAHNLTLDALVETFTKIRDEIDFLGLDAADAARLDEDIANLEQLRLQLHTLAKAHDGWQQVDVHLQRLDGDRLMDLESFRPQWEVLVYDARPLIADPDEPWAIDLSARCDGIESALNEGDWNTTRERFDGFRGKAGVRFRHVDSELLKLCRKLESLQPSLKDISHHIQ